MILEDLSTIFFHFMTCIQSTLYITKEPSIGQLFEQSRQRLTLPQKEYAVPSALEDLTSVFGMGTGVTPLL